MTAAMKNDEKLNWERLVDDELAQRTAEGCDVRAVSNPDVHDWESWKRFIIELDALPESEGLFRDEPASLEEIRAARRSAEHRYSLSSIISSFDGRVRRGWQGLCAGLFGEEEIVGGGDEDWRTECIDLALVTLKVLEERRKAHDTSQIAGTWVEHVKRVTLTGANRIGYVSLLQDVWPCDGVGRFNPYRESADVLVRAALYGCVLPGRPSSAAALAWREARITRRGSGLYGAMFVAATYAAAFTACDPEEALLIGVSEVPDSSRLNAAVRAALRSYRKGDVLADALQDVRRAQDVNDPSVRAGDVAVLSTLSLLYGEGDLCRTLDCVRQGSARRDFLVDISCAFVAGVLGVMSDDVQPTLDSMLPLETPLRSALPEFDGAALGSVADRLQAVAHAIQ